MKAVKRQKNYRVVTTHERVKLPIPMFLKGLQLDDDPEIIDNAFLSNLEGMVYFSGLFRTDWGLTLVSTSAVVDNITTVAAASVPECAA